MEELICFEETPCTLCGGEEWDKLEGDFYSRYGNGEWSEDVKKEHREMWNRFIVERKKVPCVVLVDEIGARICLNHLDQLRDRLVKWKS